MNEKESSLHEAFLHYRQGRIHYLRFGNGPKTMIAFHGFSEDARSFLELAPALEPLYRVFAIDFPFHGKTEWPGNEEFSPEDMIAVIEMLGAKEGFERFSLFGFSMGGRVVLSMLPHIYRQLDKLFLAAPDGIHTQKAFNIAVYPAWGRYLFRLISKKPDLFFFLLRIAYKHGRISRFMYEFTSNHMDTREKRERIYNTWMTLKHFQPDIPRLKALIDKEPIECHLFFGKTDEVIRPAIGTEFQKNMQHCTLDIIPKGHKLIDPVLIPYLKPYL